ncbi:MAG: penicillin amidase, partial [bacterium]
MKKVKILFLGIIVLLSISAIGGYFFLNSKLAQRSGSLKIANLKKPVNVTFDKWGIPHIYAKNELDAYRALGYLHAQDRLFQMELIRRLAKGELSEILGDKLLPIDKLFRTLRIRRYAKEYEKNTPKNTKVYRSAQAYLDGVNQFIKKGKTPIEFTMLGIPKTPFTFADSISIGGYMAYSFAAAFRTDPLLSHIKQKLGNQYLKDLAFSTTPIKSFSKKQNITN